MIGHDPQTVLSLLGFSLLGLGVLLSKLPVGTCSECVHCRMEKLARQRGPTIDAGRAYGTAFCTICGRHHDANEEHHI